MGVRGSITMGSSSSGSGAGEIAKVEGKGARERIGGGSEDSKGEGADGEEGRRARTEEGLDGGGTCRRCVGAEEKKSGIRVCTEHICVRAAEILNTDMTI